MTREEAIKIIKYGTEISKYPSRLTLTVAEVEEAKEMAIKALEQEPCEDVISRQAVRKIIDDIRDCVSVNGYWAFLERLKKLPSVNPKPKRRGEE